MVDWKTGNLQGNTKLIYILASIWKEENVDNEGSAGHGSNKQWVILVLKVGEPNVNFLMKWNIIYIISL